MKQEWGQAGHSGHGVISKVPVFPLFQLQWLQRSLLKTLSAQGKVLQRPHQESHTVVSPLQSQLRLKSELPKKHPIFQNGSFCSATLPRSTRHKVYRNRGRRGLECSLFGIDREGK